MKNRLELTHTNLHMIAMFAMLLDHLWATLFLQYEVLTCIGRIAYPIFAFLLVEGYVHTSNIKKYATRLLVFALISEIPFDLMITSTVFYPFHQNVMWTLLLGLLMLISFDKLPKKKYLNLILKILVTFVFFIVGTITFVDYYGAGLLMIAVFYLFRERKPLNIILTLVLLYVINAYILGGYYYDVVIFNYHFEFFQQAFAMLALVPIYLYKGKKGKTNSFIKYFNYLFYPLHMLVLYVIRLLIV